MTGSLLLGLCALLPQAQDRTLEIFAGFDASRQESVLRGLLRHIQLDPHPAIQRIVSRQRQHRKLESCPAHPIHSPERWAKGVAPERSLIRIGSKEHQLVRDRIPKDPFLPELHRNVLYHFATGRILRRKEPLKPAEVLENLLNGYPPGSDDALAEILRDLDRDPKQRPVAAYLDHLYADLDARVYEGITLYEAWYSGRLMDVPDVDAIPFARQILKTGAYKSPIPRGNRRTLLYMRIRDAAFAHRKYRTLRQAAAAAYIRASPKMDAEYAKLVPRFHYLWSFCGNDVDKIHQTIRKAKDREGLLELVDKQIKGKSEAHAQREQRKQELSEMAARLRYLVSSFVRQAKDWR